MQMERKTVTMLLGTGINNTKWKNVLDGEYNDPCITEYLRLIVNANYIKPCRTNVRKTNNKICIDNWESPTIPRIIINITCINKNFGGMKLNFIK